MANFVNNFFIFILIVFILALTIGFIIFLFDPDGVNNFFDNLFGNKKEKKEIKKQKKKLKLRYDKKIKKANNLKKRNIKINRPQIPSPYFEDKYKKVEYKCQNYQPSMKVDNPENFEMYVNGISQELTDRAETVN